MFLILALFVAANCWGQTADMVITGARVYTQAGAPALTSLAVSGKRILYAGNNPSPYVGPKTRMIDAKGATIIPGLIDSHVHMSSLGEELETFDLRYVRTIAEVAAIVKKAAAQRNPGEWIQGQSWDQTNWGGWFPAASDLDAAAPDNPVFLTRVDGHAAWVNHRALEIAHVTAKTTDPPGGKIHRTGNGGPTGILIDNAQDLVGAKIPPPGPEVIERRLAAAARECARLGLTSVHDAGVSAEELDAYRRLIAKNALPVRVYAMIGGNGALWRRYLAHGPEIGEHLTVRSIKLLIDGAMGSRGAAFFEPYNDDPGNTGLLLIKPEVVKTVAQEGVAHGFQVNTHAIGDRANHLVLEAYAAALGGHNDRRFRIEHAQVVAPADVPLFEKYSVIASMQSTHATSDMRWAEARIGPERVKWSYAPRRFLSIGVPVANGSDFPVEEPNPLFGFYAAITRQDRDGNPKDGWFPDQRMTREEALKSWTWTGAYAAFEEKEKGMLEPGKLADFVMLSSDIMKVPPREILTTRVLMTVVGGAVVHSELK